MFNFMSGNKFYKNLELGYTKINSKLKVFKINVMLFINTIRNYITPKMVNLIKN